MERGRYNYVVTALKPSKVDRLCVGKFTGSNDNNLITLKSNRLEVFKVNDMGLEPMLDVDIYGDIVLLDLISPNESDAEARGRLLVMATRNFCGLYEWNHVESNLVQRSFTRIPEPDQDYDRDNYLTKLLCNPIGVIDHTRRLIVLCVYDRRFEMIPFNTRGQLGIPYFKRIQLIDACQDIKFLSGFPKPTIVILEEKRFDTYPATSEDEFHPTSFRSFFDPHILDPPYPSFYPEINPIKGPRSFLHLQPRFIIPLPKPVCGFLVFGWRFTAYYGHSDSSYELTTSEHVTIISYAVISDLSYLVLDSDGCLHVLTIYVKEERYNGLKLKNLGQTSVPGASTISILSSHLVYVVSGHGDSQLLKVRSQLDQKRRKKKFRKIKGSNSYFKAVERYVNIGPIRDFCVVDLERLEQGTIVTLSESNKGGSLRVIRHGFVMNILASTKEEGITGLWSLRPRVNDTHLVVTYSSGTRILATIATTNGVLKETKIEGLSCELETLFCHDAVYDQLVQVTSSSVRLVSWTTKNLKHEIFSPVDNRFHVATANLSQVLCAGYRSLVYLHIGDGKINEMKHVEFDCDVSCLNINPIGENSVYTELAAIGSWNDRTVGIFSLPDLKLLIKEPIEDLVCSVLLSAFEGISYLMCGLGDGNLVMFSVNPKTGGLSDRKKVSLGSSPLTLRTFTFKNTTHVFAASDSPAVIYSINKKLLYSQLDHSKEVNFVCPFNSASFPDSLAVADTDGITIGMIEYQMPHIRTISFQESIQCICSQHYSRTIALCCSSSAGMGSIQLLGDRTFDLISSHLLRDLEIGRCIVSCSFFNDDTVYYCVGTSYEKKELVSSYSFPFPVYETKGRILVFAVKDRQLELVAQKEIGSVRSLTCFNGKLLAWVAPVDKEIHLYRWICQDAGGTPALELECKRYGLYDRFPIVATRGNFIVLSSDLGGLTEVLMYKPNKGLIEKIASHDANWAIAVEILDDGNTYLLADKKCDLVTIERENEFPGDDQLFPCLPVGSYHVGHSVNQFKHGSLVIQMPDSSLGRISTCIYGTDNGAIGLIASLPHDQYLFLEVLQSILRRFVRAVGDHKEWRSDIYDEPGMLSGVSMKGVRGKNFIDGDLIESFLRLNLHEKQTVSEEINLPVEELIKKVEELTRLRWGC